MEYYFSPSLSIVLEITNLNGSLKELQDLIDSNQLHLYFQRHGGLNDTCLQEADLVLCSIKISKSPTMIDALLFDLMYDDTSNDDILLQELELLSHVEDSKCQKMKAVTIKRKSLLASNISLQSARYWLETFQLYIAVDNEYQYELVAMSLSNSRFFGTCIFDNVPVMKLEVPEEDGSYMSPYSIMGLRVELGHTMNLSGSTEDSFLSGQVVATEDGIWLRCGSTISVFYALDESANQIALVSQEETMLEYLFMRFSAAIDRLDMSEEPNLTMRLKYVSIQLDLIQEHLDALGVDTITV